MLVLDCSNMGARPWYNGSKRGSMFKITNEEFIHFQKNELFYSLKNSALKVAKERW